MRHSDAALLDHGTSTVTVSKDDERLFVNRELSWIEFNRRVLHEAQRANTPLLERVKFLSILSANIDEFYMKRLGGLKQKIAIGDYQRSIDGLLPAEQFSRCRSALHKLQIDKEDTYRRIYKEMQQNDIEICKYGSLGRDEKKQLTDYYGEYIEPNLTAIPIAPAKPFPFLLNLSLYILTSSICECEAGTKLTVTHLPLAPKLPRFIQIGRHHRYALLEDVVTANVIRPLSHFDAITCNVFRITRSAVSYRDYAELDDQREIIEEELHDRKHASVIRLQVCPSMKHSTRLSLARSLNLDARQDVYESGELLRMSDLRQLASLDIPGLREASLQQHVTAELKAESSIMDAVRKRFNIILQHPYESFTQSVEQFVLEASQDSEVVSIKMTLYRTSVDTRIIDHLIAAANNGIHVSVVVELKARFDEASNLQWARRLERSGVHVHHGIAGLKTHCKFILVLRHDEDRLRKYVHVGTGNYHAGTAQLYTDLGMLTCDKAITQDIDKLFTYLVQDKQSTPPFLKILATPHVIKLRLLENINNETKLHSDTSPGYICLKTNALEDPDITLALYRASQAGVRINLIVRDICRIRPGIFGISDNISVISVVGRFLEHSRLYLFGNGGDELIYMGSADLMTRNLEKRVELLIPVTDEDSKQKLRCVLSQYLQDNYNCWSMFADSSYSRSIPSRATNTINSQLPVSDTTPIPNGIFLSNRTTNSLACDASSSVIDLNRNHPIISL